MRRGLAKPSSSGRHWSAPAGAPGTVDAFDAKGDALAVLAACGAPVQVPFRNQSMFTFPDGFGEPGWPDTVTKSCTVEPASTTVTVWCAAL